ncbi:uncharacterized protein LOC107268365 [Cephus cinctus]|uniref:Uncharacterized protein LOC107268365 n=1 Tax=Cephus cinctus TaxID=211228 RepID=A0AAJ7FKN2_CEPCN|nr:uncharacterized protein LOC107268365 [Cephus cinctus]
MNILIDIMIFLFVLQNKFHLILCTIDINLSELEYVAARLDSNECRRLIAALHYTTYELPQSMEAAERKVDEEIPCIRQLLHWNSSPQEGKGKTHEDLERRLRQLNRNDLADWLGKTAFKQLGTDLQRSIDCVFGKLGKQESETTYPITMESLDESEEENPWLPIDTILMALMMALLASLLTLIVAITLHQIKIHRRDKNFKLLME